MRVLILTACQSITVENSVCSGGHGLSIGSVGGRSDNTVDTVTFYNNEVKNSVNGESPPRSTLRGATSPADVCLFVQVSGSRP